MPVTILNKSVWKKPKEFMEQEGISKSQMYRWLHFKGFPMKKVGPRTYRVDAVEAPLFIQKHAEEL